MSQHAHRKRSIAPQAMPTAHCTIIDISDTKSPRMIIRKQAEQTPACFGVNALRLSETPTRDTLIIIHRPMR